MAKCRTCLYQREDPYTGKHCLGCNNGSNYVPEISKAEEIGLLKLSELSDILQELCHQGLSERYVKVNNISVLKDNLKPSIETDYVNIEVKKV